MSRVVEEFIVAAVDFNSEDCVYVESVGDVFPTYEDALTYIITFFHEHPESEVELSVVKKFRIKR